MVKRFIIDRCSFERDIRSANLKIEAREKYLAGHFINTVESLNLTLLCLVDQWNFPPFFFLESFIIFSILDSLITKEIILE